MYRIYIDDFWLIGDIIILKTKKEIKMKRILKFSSETNNKEFTFQAIAWRMYRNYCGTFGRRRLDEHYRNR